MAEPAHPPPTTACLLLAVLTPSAHSPAAPISRPRPFVMRSGAERHQPEPVVQFASAIHRDFRNFKTQGLRHHLGYRAGRVLDVNLHLTTARQKGKFLITKPSTIVWPAASAGTVAKSVKSTPDSHLRFSPSSRRVAQPASKWTPFVTRTDARAALRGQTSRPSSSRRTPASLPQ